MVFTQVIIIPGSSRRVLFIHLSAEKKLSEFLKTLEKFLKIEFLTCIRKISHGSQTNFHKHFTIS